MRDVAARLMARDQLGRDVFARGLIETVSERRTVRWGANLLDLLQAYARIRTKDEFRPYAFDRKNVFTMEEALERMRGMIGFAGEWADLTTWLPDDWRADPVRRRSATAATFAASLELVKRGLADMRQSDPFAPIELRRRDNV
jgi:segregation and condensation protein A